MKLEVGMYVRTKLGFITKIENEISLVRFMGEIPNVRFSHNIIDLIEVGDYVNGGKVTDKYDYLLEFGNCFKNEDEIKTIVTKEQFESMSYKVGEE